MIIPSLLAGKTARVLSKTFSIGSGSTWPGHIALKLNRKFTKEVLSKNKTKVILIAGTNGKTTTSTLLRFILEKNGISVFQNESGANLLNGIASTVVQNISFFGKLSSNVVLFETDENTLPRITEDIHPYAVILLNLFRDQLDRYGEVNTIAEKWQKALSRLPKKTILIVNGDDPELTYIAQKSGFQVIYFGIDEKYMKHQEPSHDTDFLYCPNCRTKLTFEKTSYSHMGKFYCKKCGHRRKKITYVKISQYPLLGKYNIYNTNAAAVTAHVLFDLPEEAITPAIQEFKPAFGRQEVVEYKGKKAMILLSKNPAGFNQSIDAVLSAEENPNILFVLNDRIPDGTDVSWIWDVDMEELIMKATHITVSGDRAFDMGLRVQYSLQSETQNPKFEIKEDLNQAIDTAIEKIPDNKTLYILPTYSAMLETRRIITGKAIL